MSLIHWTDISANPIHIIREDGSNGGHFCRKVSPGCLHCYSETQNQSSYFGFASKLPYAGQAPENLIFDETVMEKLLKMRSGKKVFLCSMTDLFGDWVPDEWIDKAFAYMALAKQHTFQVLTKRPERMQEYFSYMARDGRISNWATTLDKTDNDRLISVSLPLPNVWLGVSTENQETADQRIPHLLNTPAVVRFLSCEPLLEKINIAQYLYDHSWENGTPAGINWAIIGGESGAKSRPCQLDWIESIVTQCQQRSVAAFVKQWGQNAITYSPYIDGVAVSHSRIKLKDRKGGDMAEWPESIRVRQFPIVQG